MKRPLLLVAAERGGDVVTRIIPTHGKSAVATALYGVIDQQATVVTDGLPAYKHIGRRQPHLSVTHSHGQFALLIRTLPFVAAEPEFALKARTSVLSGVTGGFHGP